MSAPLSKIVVFAFAAAFAAVSVADAAPARKKPRLKREVTPTITRDYDGTPIIMQGYRVPRVTQDVQPKVDADQLKQDRPRQARRGSSTLILPPMPSPMAGPPGPPPLVQPPGVYQPPPINTFNDSVTNSIHSFPLNRGLGHNPTDLQSYIRQRAN
jgi:hypothetical protein